MSVLEGLSSSQSWFCKQLYNKYSSQLRPLYQANIYLSQVITRDFHSRVLSLWDNLPLSICSATSSASFKKHLKTYHIDLAFPHYTLAHPAAC